MDLVSTELALSAGFYNHVFGWGLTDPLGLLDGDYQMLSIDDAYLAGIEEVTSAKGPTRWTVFIITPAMADLVSRVTLNGGAVAFEPEAIAELGIVAMITDPLGATLGVWQPGTFDPRKVPNVDGRFLSARRMTSDIKVAGDFLRDVLGWTESWRDDHAVHFMTGGGSAVLCSGSAAEWVPVLEVSSLDRTTEAIRKAGGTHGPESAEGIVEAHDHMGATFLLQEN
jgi:hypothetical protein